MYVQSPSGSASGPVEPARAAIYGRVARAEDTSLSREQQLRAALVLLSFPELNSRCFVDVEALSHSRFGASETFAREVPEDDPL